MSCVRCWRKELAGPERPTSCSPAATMAEQAAKGQRSPLPGSSYLQGGPVGGRNLVAGLRRRAVHDVLGLGIFQLVAGPAV